MPTLLGVYSSSVIHETNSLRQLIARLLADCYKISTCEGENFIIAVGLRFSEREISQKIGFAKDGFAVAGHLYGSKLDRCTDVTNPDDDSLVRIKKLVLDSSGVWLARSIQGRYVAVAVDNQRNKIQIYRDPLGLSTMYYAKRNSQFIFASELALVAALLLQQGIQAEINTSFMLSTVVHSTYVSDRTPLCDVYELRPGEMLEIFKTGKRKQLIWNPIELAQQSKNRPPIDRKLLRSKFMDTVSGCLGTNDNVYVDFSGGLDSSAVLAASMGMFDSQRRRVVPVNVFYPSVASATELRFARQVATALKVELFEINGESCLPFTPSKLASRKWSRPDANFPYLKLHEAHSELATDLGCSFMVDGFGGDQMFQAPFEGPIHLADYLVTGRLASFASEVGYISRNLGISYFGALSWVTRSITDGFLGNHDKRVSIKSPSWFSPELIANATPRLFRPSYWHSLRRLPPCKARQVLAIYDGSAYVDHGFRLYGNPKHHPFLSLGLVELALLLPIEDSYAQGRDRIAFREAMSGVLPDLVINRHSKADHTGVLQLGLRANLKWIEDMALNGWLAKNGLVRKDKLRIDLRRAAQGFALDMWPLVNVVSVEMWLAAWGLG